MLVDPPSQISFYFRICLLVMYLLGGIVNLLRMNSLAQRGQGLLDEAQNCVDYLQMLRVREGVGMEEQDLVKLGVLTEKMAAYQGIRPKDYFTLCQSSKLSGIGLSLTYYIVLLQFRASE